MLTVHATPNTLRARALLLFGANAQQHGGVLPSVGARATALRGLAACLLKCGFYLVARQTARRLRWSDVVGFKTSYIRSTVHATSGKYHVGYLTL